MKASFAALLLLALAGCAANTVVTPVGRTYAARPADCPVVIRDKTLPAGPYEVIGKIESHLERDYFFGGTVRLQDQYKELRQKACQLGGDVVVIQDYIESDAAEMSHVHVWATVLRMSRPD